MSGTHGAAHTPAQPQTQTPSGAADNKYDYGSIDSILDENNVSQSDQQMIEQMAGVLDSGMLSAEVEAALAEIMDTKVHESLEGAELTDAQDKMISGFCGNCEDGIAGESADEAGAAFKELQAALGSDDVTSKEFENALNDYLKASGVEGVDAGSFNSSEGMQ